MLELDGLTERIADTQIGHELGEDWAGHLQEAQKVTCCIITWKLRGKGLYRMRTLYLCTSGKVRKVPYSLGR